jgi:hypothetical protein
MEFFVNILQLFVGDVSVDLCGGNVGMPEHHQHRTDIGAVLQKVGRKGVV